MSRYNNKKLKSNKNLIIDNEFIKKLLEGNYDFKIYDISQYVTIPSNSFIPSFRLSNYGYSYTNVNEYISINYINN